MCFSSLGNPVGLASEVATGFHEFVHQPHWHVGARAFIGHSLHGVSRSAQLLSHTLARSMQALGRLAPMAPSLMDDAKEQSFKARLSAPLAGTNQHRTHIDETAALTRALSMMHPPRLLPADSHDHKFGSDLPLDDSQLSDYTIAHEGGYSSDDDDAEAVALEVLQLRTQLATQHLDFGHGLYRGLEGLFVAPLMGLQEHGVLGLVYGVGRIKVVFRVSIKGSC